MVAQPVVSVLVVCVKRVLMRIMVRVLRPAARVAIPTLVRQIPMLIQHAPRMLGIIYQVPVSVPAANVHMDIIPVVVPVLM